MTRLLFIVICGLLAIQLVSSQPSRTTWSAAMRPGLEGVPVRLLAVPGSSPGLRVLYNAIKTDKRIMELLKAGILAPLSNSIVLLPGGKTTVKTTKTTVVETLTSEGDLHNKAQINENVPGQMVPENNLIPGESIQGPGLNLDLLNKRINKLSQENKLIPIKNVQGPRPNLDILDKRIKNVQGPRLNLEVLDNTIKNVQGPRLNLDILDNTIKKVQGPRLNLDILDNRIKTVQGPRLNLELLGNGMKNVHGPRLNLDILDKRIKNLSSENNLIPVDNVQSPGLNMDIIRNRLKNLPPVNDLIPDKNIPNTRLNMDIVNQRINQFSPQTGNPIPRENVPPRTKIDILNENLKEITVIPNRKTNLKPGNLFLPGNKVQRPRLNRDIINKRLQKLKAMRKSKSNDRSQKYMNSPTEITIVTKPPGQFKHVGHSRLSPSIIDKRKMGKIDHKMNIINDNKTPLEQKVNVALDYDSKALTDTLLVMLKTMHMIQRYIKDTLTTTTPKPTTTTPKHTTPTTTTTTTTQPTTTRKRMPIFIHYLTTTNPTTTSSTTTPTTTVTETTTEYYPTEETMVEMETTTELPPSTNQTGSISWTPEVIDFINSFKEAISVPDKKPTAASPIARVEPSIKPAEPTYIPITQTSKSALDGSIGTKVSSRKRTSAPTKATLRIPDLPTTRRRKPSPSPRSKPKNNRKRPTNIQEKRLRARARAAGRAAKGGMTTVPPDFTDYQNSMAIANIHGAKTENQAAYAAATVFHPARDMADNVQQALESKVRQLRGVNGVFVPFNFDVMHLVMGAYHRTLDPNAAQPTGPNAGPMSGPMGSGPAMGPPTAIRRGARPGSGPGMGGPMGGPMGGHMGGMYSPFEPTQWEINSALQDIHMATTEAEAVKAAASVHRVGLDLADVVVNAVEEKIARLRHPNWNRPRPPPIPRGLNVLRLVMRAFQEIQRAKQAKAAADAARAEARAAAQAARARKKARNPQPPPPAGPPNNPPAPPSGPPPSAPQPPKQPPPMPGPPPSGPRQPKGDFMSSFIQQRRQQRQPPPVPKLFKSRPTKPKPPAPFVKPARREPTDPYLSQPLFRPKPQVEPFRPPPNVPTPPKINWNNQRAKPASKSLPKANVMPTTATEKRPSAVPKDANKKSSSASAFKPQAAKTVVELPMDPTPMIKPMKLPKANLPPPPYRSEPARSPKNLFPKRNTGRPSDIPGSVLSSKNGDAPKRFTTTKPTESTPKPQDLQLFNRYPGLFENKAKERAARLRMAKPEAGPPRRVLGKAIPPPSPVIKPVIKPIAKPAPKPPVQAATKVEPKISRPSKIWSPLGNLGSNINEILKFSIGGPAESVPIPTAPPPKPTTTVAPVTTKKPIPQRAPTKPKKPKKSRKSTKRRKPVTKAKSKAVAVAKPKAKPAAPKGGNKLVQLQSLLEGISPSQLQTLVDLIKAKSSEGKPKPAPKQDPLPKPKPIFIPPPPGSENRGPGKMRGPQGGPQGPPSSRGPYGPNRDYGPPPQDNRGAPPPWARGPGGPPMGGPMGPMRGPMGRPGGAGGPGASGPLGGLDMNNPQVARLIRVLKSGGHPKQILSGRSQGGNNAAAAEAPEAGEGPTGMLGNPLMMMMLNQGGQGANGLSALLGGGAGAGNPLAALMGGGAAGGGGGQMDMMSLLGANGGSGASGTPAGGQMDMMSLLGANGGSGASGTPAGNPLAMFGALGGMPGAGGAGAGAEGGMNPAMLSALMRAQGGGGGGQGLNGLARMLSGGGGGGQGNLGLLAAMANPDGPDFLTSGAMGGLGGGLGGMGGLGAMFGGLGM